MKIEAVTLEGKSVRLAPLKLEHLSELYETASDESLWLLTANVIKSRDDLRRYVETALDEQTRKVSLPFVTVEKSTNKITGSTRFGNIDVRNRKTEIGWTWINPKWQRTAINTEAKLLMLTHAFEFWKCVRVELKTDALNEKSRKAIARIGAKEEGIFRKHLITDAGRFRDTVFFSIIDSEWQTVKANLTDKLRSF
ncbi:MAG: GNAT family N-acetyltransferase [Acidobacteria bacterium]|jgi:RimJ/RimL family protein N-acetyltransferase|nr:GNAT family N-acetyltransferase [Acidobacteriota bacterium]